MAVQQTTSTIMVEMDTFLFYRKSRVGIIGAKLLSPIISQGKIFCREGELCNIKFRLDLIDFSKISHARVLDIIIENSCEEKLYKGNTIKQFTAKSFTDYKSDARKTVSF